MAPRAFTVFVDKPSQPAAKPVLPTSALNTNTAASSTTEKENLHPVTGQHATSSSETQIKKKKSAVLTTKLYTPFVHSKARSCDQASSNDGHVASRKRSALAASGAQTTMKKLRSISESDKSGGFSLTHKAKPLPKLEEEPEPDVLVAGSSQQAHPDADARDDAQADIDSKCYALTVSPLADVSQAFDKVSVRSTTSSSTPCSDDTKTAVENTRTRDAVITITKFASLRERHSTKHSVLAPPPNSAHTNQDSKRFSTPERKLIYSAFTFSSPSPTARRFAAARSGAGVESVHFGDLKFNFP
ncbi:hypothetical protein K488DRAFT_85457 [Vararia minispora EC-137]|uniref:Uncharacterized protein n=1 Tax=Vararia minispora EC-137 TaxID=1314806 RepID=A0ACB8QM13_9AGAM|nr:hypothetical protein K488DRAFT_85457 [Vararia minispora EC-137]